VKLDSETLSTVPDDPPAAGPDRALDPPPREAHNPEWKARRWVVEACHSWMNRNRGILIRWSKKEENHLALLQLSSGLIAYKKANLATITATQPG
jgi:hypothetical protein